MIIRIFFCCLLFTASVSAQDSLAVINYDSLFAKAKATQPEYRTLSLKANLVYDDGNTAQQFNATIRSQRDSIVWSSLGMFGFEGVRTLITTDSFRLINKLTAEYLTQPLSFIQNYLSFPLTFQQLQQIISGEIISIEPQATFAKTEDSSFVLYQETGQLLQEIRLNNQNYTVSKILLKDKLLQQTLSISFGAYNFSEPKPFAYKRVITVTRNTTTMNINMDILKARWNEELQFPFEVTEKHKKTE